MTTAASVALSARRFEQRVFHIRFRGVDWSGLSRRMQVRLERNQPGAALFTVDGVAGAVPTYQGLGVAVAVEGGVPVTTITGLISQATMSSAAALPYGGELGSDDRYAWALQVGGVTRVWGDFWALASAIDSDGAPRTGAGYGGVAGGPGTWDTMTLTVADQEVISVSIDGVDELAPLVAAAATSAAGAAGSRAAAQAAAAAADADRVAAQVAAQSAGDSAAAAGAYRTAVQQAVAGLPTGQRLTVQAADRSIMAGFTGMSAGDQVQLGEAGREGIFVWLPGDRRTLVTGDPYQALYVPRSGAADGAQGAWQRRHDGRALASWAGVVADGATAWHAQLNSLLQHPELCAVEMAEGVTGFARPILKRSGMALEGRGQGVSVLRAIGYVIQLGTSGRGQQSCTTLPGARGCADRRFTLDIAKTGALDGNTPGTGDQQQRVHAICPVDSVDYECEDVEVLNCTGYAFVAFGGQRGSFRRTRSVNAQVHLEFTNVADGWTAEDPTFSAGDGDIGSEAVVHFLNGSRRCVVRNPQGVDLKSGNGIYSVNNSNPPIDMWDNRVESGSLALAQNSPGIGAQNLGTARHELEVAGTAITTLGLGVGNNSSRVRVIGGAITAGAVGASGAGAGMTLLRDVRMDVGQGLASNSYAGPISVDNDLFEMVVDGGELNGKPNGENSYQVGAKCRVMASPRITPAPGMPVPLGPGHRFQRATTQDETGANRRIRVGTTEAFGVQMRPGVVLRISVAARAQSNRGVMIGLDGVGNGGSISGTGTLRPAAGGPETTAALTTWGDGLDGNEPGNAVAIGSGSPQDVVIALDAIVTAPASGQSFVFVRIAPTYDKTDTTGSLTLLKGAVMTVEHLA